jgi:hypothetical protein
MPTTADTVPKRAVKNLAMLESSYLVHPTEDQATGALQFGVELAQHMRVVWKFRREDYKDEQIPWNVLAANATLACSRTVAVYGKATLRTATGDIIFEGDSDDVYILAPDGSYMCKVYNSMFQSIIIALAASLAPFQKRDRDE